jgi:hypothetical protein
LSNEGVCNDRGCPYSHDLTRVAKDVPRSSATRSYEESLSGRAGEYSGSRKGGNAVPIASGTVPLFLRKQVAAGGSAPTTSSRSETPVSQATGESLKASSLATGRSGGNEVEIRNIPEIYKRAPTKRTDEGKDTEPIIDWRTIGTFSDKIKAKRAELDKLKSKRASLESEYDSIQRHIKQMEKSLADYTQDQSRPISEAITEIELLKG